MSDLALRISQGLEKEKTSSNPETCFLCHDTGMKVVETEIAADASVRAGIIPANPRGPAAMRCDCETARLFAERVARSLAIVPARYQSARLDILEPRTDRLSGGHPKQVEAVAYMKAHPEENYFFAGPPDTGKTHLFWTLYDYAARQGKEIFACSVFKLIEAIKFEMLGRVFPVTVPRLEETGAISIFLEDANKARPTEFVAERFFNFLDDAYNLRCHMVVTSQLNTPELAKYFDIYDKETRIHVADGTAIVRRMANDETNIWRFF
jgi:DNA replication protein DnaC